jgi:hypothetical protein
MSASFYSAAAQNAQPAPAFVESPALESGAPSSGFGGGGGGGGGMPFVPSSAPPAFAQQQSSFAQPSAPAMATMGGMAPAFGGGGVGSFGEDMGNISSGFGGDELDPYPLLEELGIHWPHIVQKTKAVLIPRGAITDELANSVREADLAGPFVFCILLGLALMPRGKLHYGYIFGFGTSGSVGLYAVLNLMSRMDIELLCIVSILGYCMLPIVLLALLSYIISLQGTFGFVLSALVLAWCTATSTRFFEAVLTPQHQRWLIAYPVFLLYACFALITVF